jgi:hypothetical protein
MASVLLTGGSMGFGQTPNTAADRSQSAESKKNITYGRIKEVTPGRKIVIDIDNKLDKSFDLTDTDQRFHLASGLKVGDPVMVTERERSGKKVVDIAHHSGGGIKHGDKTRAEEVQKK